MLPVENRIREFMEHSVRYAFMGESRLAKDCGVSVSSVCRLIIGYGSPSFAIIFKITAALEKEFDKPIDPREVASIDGMYPTGKVCDVVDCKGCTPQTAWNSDDTLKDNFRHLVKSHEGSQEDLTSSKEPTTEKEER